MTKLTFPGRPVFLMAVLCILLGLSAWAQAPGKISLDMKNVPLAAVLAAIEKQTGTPFIYNRQQVDKVQVASASYQQKNLTEVLNHLLGQYQFGYKLEGGNIILFPQVKKEEKKSAANPGKVTGKIIDEENGQPVEGATVRIGNKGTTTAIDGSYSLSLPKGGYTATVSYVGYGTKEISEIIVRDDETFPLNVTLKREKGQLATVVVKSSASRESVSSLYARQKNAASVTDGISMEQISRTPDNNVAQVLRRVSGLNVQENKFVTVRGLSDRYNNVMMNGSLLPSTEPNQRNFSFDVIPNGLIDNVVVYKTATPDITGEFSGGVVEINTKDIPDENLLRLKVGTGSNSRATGKDFYQPKRGKTDFLAFDDGGRKLPASYSPTAYARAIAQGYNGGDAASRATYGAISAQFPNRFTMYKYTGMPVQDYELNLGRVTSFKNSNRLGGVFALTYRNEQTAQSYIENGIPDMFHFVGDRYSFSTTVGGLLNFGYTFGKNKLAVKNLFSRKLTENAFIFGGKNTYTGNDIDGYGNTTLIQTISQNRLEGEHIIGRHDLKINWHGGFSLTRRDQPDNKGFFGEKRQTEESPFEYIYGVDNLEHVSSFYGKLTERRYTWSAEARQPFNAFNRKQQVKIGYQGNYRTADFLSELFTIMPEDRTIERQSYGLSYDQAFAPENFGNGKLIYLPYLARVDQAGRGGNGYTGFQRLNSFYGMLDGLILPKLRFIGGIRVENNELNTNTLSTVYEPTGVPVTKDTLLGMKTTDWLPSVNLIYSVTNKFNIRGAYYYTVARPDFRELSGVQTYEPDKKTYIIGKNLRPTSIRNADIRFEYYPSPLELISVSGFYKKFRDPIELQVQVSSQNTEKAIFLVYANLEEATDYGIELNFRKSFNFINASSGFLKDLYLSGNLTFIKAQVILQGARTDTGQVGMPDGTTALLLIPAQQNRPLYGQANYIINGGLLYTGKRLGFNIAYNRTGPKIVYGSEILQYNEWEGPRDVIDVQLSCRFLKRKNAEIKLNVSDLLNQPIIRYYHDYKPSALQGQVPPGPDGFIRPPVTGNKGYNKDTDELRRKYVLGRNMSLSFSYAF